MKKELELYIHIPFCSKKCKYCDFLSGPANLTAQRDYVNALLREIQYCGDFSEYQVSSIFIGGGTPSILPGEWIGEIMDAIKREFSISDQAEISIEANPGTVTREKLQQYRQAGISRISFGCQSTHNEELKVLGRIHTWENFLESFRLAREAGFSNINVDLMSGLPNQTLDSWKESLRKIAQLNPEHISAYSLIIEEGTPFFEMDLNLPDEDVEREMYEQTKDVLEEYGYQQYEISNYGKPGYACRHNLGYWRRVEYLGLGLGSASLVKEFRFSNITDWKEYVEHSSCCEKIRKDVQQLSVQEQMEETMFLGLRTMKGVSKDVFWNSFHISMEEVYGDVIKKYVAMGLLEWSGPWIRLTRQGISVSNQIMSDFLLDV